MSRKVNIVILHIPEVLDIMKQSTISLTVLVEQYKNYLQHELSGDVFIDNDNNIKLESKLPEFNEVVSQVHQLINDIQTSGSYNKFKVDLPKSTLNEKFEFIFIESYNNKVVSSRLCTSGIITSDILTLNCILFKSPQINEYGEVLFDKILEREYFESHNTTKLNN